jgi:hypothetical protein
VPETTTLPIDQVRYLKEFQPRIDVSDGWIEQLRTALDKLPPVVVARGSILVDGYHRWQAHLREGAAFIDVEDLGEMTDDEIFWEAVRRNATPGRQLSLKDKRDIAASRYEKMDPASAVAELADRLSVDERTVQRWTKDARAAQAQTRQAKAWDLWLDCRTQDEIGKYLDTPQKTISNWVSSQERQLSEMANAPGATDEKPWGNIQHFDVWQFPTTDRDAGGQQSYFGAVPPQVIENLLWFFTEPGATVVDLFAGSGTTVDVAKRMGRRVWAADIRGNHYSPHLPIHAHDATTGWPESAPRKADLVFLDPPYWKQAIGRYSSEPNELAEMTLDDFTAAWASVVKSATDHAARVAFIISPTQNEDGSVVDHATQMIQPFTAAGWRVERRIIVPYSTQQATGQQVTWARENRRMLKLYRDLVVLSA